MHLSKRLVLLIAPFTLTSFASAGGAEALFRVRFEATWSDTSHPTAFPGSSAHFSPLIGATHDSNASFWAPGGQATLGIEHMAEFGSTSTLSGEVADEIALGNAGEVILGSGPSSPGSALTTFTVTDAHPLVTLTTMIAPSPDWFVGVYDLPLFENGSFVDELVVDLYAWDAGTDDGLDFFSSNADSSPAQPIALITDGPFFGTTPLGTFTFTRVASTVSYGCGNPAESLRVESGLPELGGAVTVVLADPSGQTDSGSASFLAVSLDPAPGYPCGPPLIGFGLGTDAQSPGELLILDVDALFVGPPTSGSSAELVFGIPDEPVFAGLRLYLQGFLVEPDGDPGATNAVELTIGV